jgi:hypothetical protein
MEPCRVPLPLLGRLAGGTDADWERAENGDVSVGNSLEFEVATPLTEHGML